MPDHDTIRIRMLKSINTAATPVGKSTVFRQKGEVHAVWPDLAHALIRANCAVLVEDGEIAAEGATETETQRPVPDPETEGGAGGEAGAPTGDKDVKVDLVEKGGAPGGKTDPVAVGEKVEAVVKSDDETEKVVAPKDVALEMVARGGGLFDIQRQDTGEKINVNPMKKADAQALLDNSTNE